MKSLLLSALVLVLAQSASAHTLENLKSPSSQAIQALNALSATLQANEETARWTGSGSYKVTQISPKRKAGESNVDLYSRVLEYALHRDYPVTGDDGGYRIDVLSSKAAIEKAAKDFSDFDETQSALKAALEQAQDEGLLVLSVSGNGNNTMAIGYAIIDTKNRELAYLINSNFGSDE